MKRSLILALFLATEFASGFQAIQSNSAFVTKKQFKNAALFMSPEKESFDPVGLASETISEDRSSKTALLSAAGLISSGLLSPSISNAAGPDWGIFEGRTGSLLHPAMMAGMLLLSVSTGLKGFQYRRLRTIGGEITEMKKGLPKFEGKSLSEAIRNMEAMEEVDVAAVSKLKAALPLEKEINDLVVERKGLSSLAPRDSHFSQGATLAFLGTAFAIEGPLNTYARAGKLFPGPHLYAGAGLVVLWALAYAQVPAMQKGSETARNVHIGANFLGIALFAWQVQSGIPILLKVIEKTSWP